LLGELLYERGQLDEAETLLDTAYELGAEGGLVDFMFAAFGTGARLKFARGDKVAADRRLVDGLEIARQLRLPRLEARLTYEQVRLAALSGGAIDESLAQRVMAHGPQNLDGIGDTTAEFKEDAHTRVLLLQGQSIGAACDLARARRDHLDQRKRPRAHLQATLQYALCLAVAGNNDEARSVLAPALRTCAALGLSRLLIDEGPPMLRLAADTVAADEFTAVDPTTSANVREFVSSLAEASTA
jgi:hypothetical protein